MAILLIYHFNPHKKLYIDDESKFLFFLFGIVIILTSDWKTMFNSIHNPQNVEL
jgi:hypothetical protein